MLSGPGLLLGLASVSVHSGLDHNLVSVQVVVITTKNMVLYISNILLIIMQYTTLDS